MSARLFSIALDTDTPPNAKLVLAKMADCCDDEGKRIYPSVATLARAGSCSERQVQRVLKLACGIGLLRINREGGAGRRSTTHYEMDVSLLERLRQGGLWASLTEEWERRRLTQDEAAEDFDSHAPDAEQEPGKQVDSAAAKGDRVSPLQGLRVTPTTSKGDSACHPTPQEEPSDSEREDARALQAGEPSPASDAPDASHAADAGPQPTLGDFRKAWPTTLADSNAMVEAAWAALPFGERRAALDGIRPFLAGLKAIGRTKVPAGSTYLAQRKWHDVPAMAAQRGAGVIVEVAPWSKPFWGLVFAKVRRGQPIAFAFVRAAEGKAMSSTAGDMPSETDLGALQGYRCDGPEIAAWRPWLAARGARLPDFKGDFRVFLPAPMPPGGKQAEGDDDVRL